MSLQDKSKDIQSSVDEQLASRAEELFRQGFNCCESILKASSEVFKLGLPDDIFLMGRFFRQGIGSGCICGALAGGIMVLGYMSGGTKSSEKLAKNFRSKFIGHFGSTCCRVIRKKQSITDRFRNIECRKITKVSAGLIQELLGIRGEIGEGK